MPTLGGGFGRRRRLDTPPRQRSKPLEMGETEKRWMSMSPPGSGTRLGRAGYGPKPPSLPENFIYAKGASVGDVICCEGDAHLVIGKVIGHRKDGMVVCRDLATGTRFGVGPDVIVELGVGS